VTLSFDGQKLDGRLSLLVNEDGNLVDSTLGISRLGSAAISGTFKCTAGPDTGCRLEAETASGIATNAPSEVLALKGTTKALAGKLGVRGQNTTFGIRTGDTDD
jgi:hypothetical protein